jgi:hypothetical protein
MRSEPHEQKCKFLRKPALELAAGCDFVVRSKLDDSLKGMSHRILASIFSSSTDFAVEWRAQYRSSNAWLGHHP